MAAMILNSPPHCRQCSRSIPNTRQSRLAQPIPVNTPSALELHSAIALEPLVGNRRARDVAAQAFEFLALIRTTAHCGVQAEAVRFSAQVRRVFFSPAGHRSQDQYLLSSSRPQRNAMRARRRLQ